MKSIIAILLMVEIFLHQSLGAPNTAEDQNEKYLQQCAKILHASDQTKSKMQQRNLNVDEPEMNCMIRCVGILGNMYADATGTNWDEVTRRMKDHTAEQYERHRLAVTECVEAMPQEDDVCRKAYQTFRCHSQSIRKIRAGLGA